MEANSAAKTLGPQAARLLTELHARGRTTFTLDDVGDITGLQPAPARSFVAKVVRRGLATRVKPGLFVLVPFELGYAREYQGNPFVVARELAGGRDYFLSHASAMDLHGMVTQPQLVVYVTTLHPLRGRDVAGTEYRFVRARPPTFFGTTDQWVDKRERVAVSDLERTVLDGLRQPAYCGGVTEVAKGLWMRHADVRVDRLVEYALRLDVGSVIRRLGYLLELGQLASAPDLERLRARLTAAYQLLDPTLPAEGPFVARWRLRLNVTPEELVAVRST